MDGEQGFSAGGELMGSGSGVREGYPKSPGVVNFLFAVPLDGDIKKDYSNRRLLEWLSKQAGRVSVEIILAPLNFRHLIQALIRGPAPKVARHHGVPQFGSQNP